MGQQPFYKKKFTNQKLLKNASFVNKYGIYLPNHASLEPKNLDYIIKHFKSFAKPIFFKS
jgi:dTDP-4-amino-4,6-dideoxygalactose transaminase